ncbi:MAG: hypothetical protein HQM10_06905 [Candidatus Riflebacteria bacterium]|nr:hypothetical protein [Candidatus Riflebacteria bacterium]
MPGKLSAPRLSKFIGDTYFDALMQAKNAMGDNISVISSKPIQKKSWGGIFTQEMIEITVAALRSEEEKQIRSAAPSRPVLSEDVTGVKIPEIHKPVMPPPVPAVPDIPIKPGYSTGILRDQKKKSEPPVQKIPIQKKPEPEVNPGMKMADECSSALERALDEIVRVRDLNRLDVKDLESEYSNSSKLSTLSQSQQDFHSNDRVDKVESKISELNAMLADLKKIFGEQVEKPRKRTALPEALETLRNRLVEIDTPVTIQEELLLELSKTVPSELLQSNSTGIPEIRKYLLKKLKFLELPKEKKTEGPLTIVLMGPTGVGKTTTLAKLAAAFALDVMNTRSVAIFTLDTYRIGATDQLCQYAQIMGTAFEILFEYDEIKPAMEKHKNKDIILVDTAGRGQKDHKDFTEMKKLISCFQDSKKFLVLDATSKFSDLLEMEKRFSMIGYDGFVFTKVDDTNSIGPLLALLMKTEKPLSYITDGQTVPDDLKIARSDFFLSSLFSNTMH